MKTLKRALFGAEIPGGNYTAVEFEYKGRTWVKILDVPIFCNVPKNERGNKNPIGPEWQDLALAKAKDREEKDNYLPPLHFHHHSWGDSAEAAGFFRLTRRGLITYEGLNIDALFADLLVPLEKAAMIEAAEFPYRSVEVFDWDAPEINSLALLDHEVPFFRLELLTIGERVKATSGRDLIFADFDDQPARSAIYCGAGGVATFSFNKTTFAVPPKADDDETKKKTDENNPATASDKKGAKVEGGDEDDPKTEPCPDCEGSGLTADEKFCPTCKGTGETAGTETAEPGETPADMGEADMKTLLQNILTTNQQILAALGKLGSAPAVDPASPPAEPPDPAKKNLAATDPELHKELAAVAAEASAARKEVAVLKEDARVAAAVKDVIAKKLPGRNLDATDIEKLERFARKDASLLNDFAEALAAKIHPDPAGDPEDTTTGLPAGEAEPEALRKFATDPKLYAEAKGYYRQWQELRAKGFDRPAEVHIDIQMRHARKEIGAGKNF